MEKPVLSTLQQAWLREIGIQAPVLRQLGLAPAPAVATPASPAPMHASGGAAAGFVATPVRPQHGNPAAGESADAEAARSIAPTARAPIVAPSATTPASRVENAPADRPAASPASSFVPSTASTVEALGAEAAACVACGLHEVRGRVVFGEGAQAQPQFMFVGEAPGEYDDSAGKPFQGRSGELLRAMLAAAGLDSPELSYFTNVLKCRPLGNRSPEPDEIAACMPLLRRQIRLIQPRCLVALGRVSAAALLGRDQDIESLRGTLHTYADGEVSVPLIVTHHPAMLLLHGGLKAEAWRDLNLLRTTLS